MSHTIAVEQASANLGELVRALKPGDEIILTADEKPVVRIVPDVALELATQKTGTWKGQVEIVDGGDEVILEHFKQYLP